MSATRGPRGRRLRFLHVVGEALDALHSHGDGDPAAAAGHLRRTARLATQLADLIDAEPEVSARERR